MTFEEMFLWIKNNKVSIVYHEPMNFYMQDGSMFVSDFYLTTGKTRFASFPTLEQAIVNAAEVSL